MAGQTASGEDVVRGQWNSRLGYILAMVGSAVGLGNIVRFPFVTSQNGGGAFVLIYLICVIFLGVPMVLAELTLGRRSQRNVVDTFRNLGGNRWIAAGLFFVLVNIFVMGWYSVIGGWTLMYIIDGVQQAYWTAPAEYFLRVSEGPIALLFHAIFISITIGIVAGGVSESIEPVVQILMPTLAGILVALAVYGVLQTGAADGLTFYLQPDLSKVNAGTISSAAGQAFFSMSVGFGALITYASYMSRDSSLTEDGFIVGLSDTGIALTAGFVVFPLLAAFALLGTPEAQQGGIGVAFLALPSAFATIGGMLGTLLGVAFFFLLFAAALSSSISLMEVGVGWLTDQGLSRVKSALALGLGMYALGILMAFSSPLLNLLSGAITSAMVIFGGLLVALFLTWFYPRMLDEDPVAEMERGTEGMTIGSIAIPLVKWPIPIVLMTLLGVEVAGILGVAMTTGLFVALAYYSLAVLLGIYTHFDAGDREMDPGLWTVLVLLTGIAGLVVYLLVRDDLPAAASAE